MTNPMREALEAAEAVMSIVEPRNHKAEYLEVLGKVRAALSAEWRPDPDTVEVCAQAIERMPISPMWSGWYRKEAEKARAKAVTAIRSLRSLFNHPSAEKGE